MQHAKPEELRLLVLEYLSHSGYVRSAQSFLRDSAVQHIDADGDEVMKSGSDPVGSDILSESIMQQAEFRNQIRHEIRCGRVSEATDLLNKYFPSVLAMNQTDKTEHAAAVPPSNSTRTMDYVAATSVKPEHLFLNLRIQAFIEDCRTVPLPYPPTSNDTAMQSHAEDVNMDAEAKKIDQQTNLLRSARKLHAFVNRDLTSEQDRSRYMAELNGVIGLIAYTEPEKSPVAKYLQQERREALADQLNSAILAHSKLPVISRLEFQTRSTSTIWSFLHELRVKPKAGTPLPPSNDAVPAQHTKKNPTNGESEPEVPVCPPFDIQAFLGFKS